MKLGIAGQGQCQGNDTPYDIVDPAPIFTHTNPHTPTLLPKWQNNPHSQSPASGVRLKGANK